MVESVNGTIIENDDFSVRVFEDPEQYLMQMIPVEKKLKGFFDSIHIIANKKSFSVTVIEMNETSGDRTIIKFNQQKLNTVLSDEIFTRN